MTANIKSSAVAARATPHLDDRRRTVDRTTALYAAALILPILVSIHQSSGSILPLLVSALIIAAGWATLFARLRHHRFEGHAMIGAAIFALMVPPSIPLWQALLALSFGIVVAEQIFGGRGYGFLSAPVTALAFQLFSFPGSTEPATSGLIALSVIPGAAILLSVGLVAWRVALAFAIGLFAALAISGFSVPLQSLFTASLALGVAFLVCDPVNAACTNIGRWAYGVLAGVLVVILTDPDQGTGHLAAIVFASLLAGIFAPLIDRIVIMINVNRRRRRNG